MVGRQTLAELTAISTGAVLDPSLWQKFLSVAAGTIGTMATHLIRFGPDGEALGEIGHGYDPVFITTYAEYYATRNAWAPGIVPFPEGSIIAAEQMCPDAKLIRTEWYNDWIRPQDDIALGGGGMIAKGADGIFLLGGNIPRRAGAVAERAWLDLVRLLAPQLRNVWEMSRALTSERLGTGGAASFVVRPDHRLVFLNSAGTSLLIKGNVLGLDARGRLAGMRADVDFWLGNMLARLRLGGFGGQVFRCAMAGKTTVQLRGTAFNSDLIGETWPLDDQRYSGPRLLLTVSENRSPLSIDRRLARQLGTTEAEASVARELANGLSPGEIADQRSVSVHTVRNQLKSAMSKCGVRRQTQLILAVHRAMRRLGPPD